MDKIIAFFMSIITMITSFFSSLFPFAEKNYDVFKDIAYGTEIREVMDIYIPDSAYERVENGCILYIHGGSWTSGDKKDEASKCANMAEKGYITATMSYMLFTEENASEYSVDVVLDEINMALQKIKDFCSEKGINITKAATSGFSAGAHLSMLYSYSRADSAPIKLAFTANQVGPSDLSYDIWGDTGIYVAAALAGTEITEEMIANGEAEKIITAVSPVTYVNENSIPSLFAYGGKDTVVPKGNGESIKSAFEESGVKFDYILFPNSNHFLWSDPDCSELYQKTLEDYCKSYFGY